VGREGDSWELGGWEGSGCVGRMGVQLWWVWMYGVTGGVLYGESKGESDGKLVSLADAWW
jgi:hypothetical protein